MCPFLLGVCRLGVHACPFVREICPLRASLCPVLTAFCSFWCCPFSDRFPRSLIIIGFSRRVRPEKWGAGRGGGGFFFRSRAHLWRRNDKVLESVKSRSWSGLRWNRKRQIGKWVCYSLSASDTFWWVCRGESVAVSRLFRKSACTVSYAFADGRERYAPVSGGVRRVFVHRERNFCQGVPCLSFSAFRVSPRCILRCVLRF